MHLRITLAAVLALLGTGCAGTRKNARPMLIRIDSETRANITGVWLDTHGLLWVATPSNSPAIRRFADDNWTDQSRGFPAGAVADFLGTFSGALIAYNHSEIYRYEEGGWKRIFQCSEPSQIGVACAEDGTVVAVTSYYPKWFEFSLDNPEEVQTHGGGVDYVWIFAKDHYLTMQARTEKGSASLSAPSGDRELPFPDAIGEKGLFQIWSPDGREVLVVGEKGLVLRLVNDKWQVEKTPTRNDLFSVWGNRSDRCVAVGDNGTILLYDGTAWNQLPSGTKEALNSVRGGKNGRIFIGGNKGTLFELVWP